LSVLPDTSTAVINDTCCAAASSRSQSSPSFRQRESRNTRALLAMCS
jgi:hypothetical protein